MNRWRRYLRVIWSWGGLETARERHGKVGDCFGEVFGGFRGKSRWSFRTFPKKNRVHVGPKSFSRTFSIHREGFRAQNKANIFKKKYFPGSDFFYYRNSIPLVVNPDQGHGGRVAASWWRCSGAMAIAQQRCGSGAAQAQWLRYLECCAHAFAPGIPS